MCLLRGSWDRSARPGEAGPQLPVGGTPSVMAPGRPSRWPSWPGLAGYLLALLVCFFGVACNSGSASPVGNPGPTSTITPGWTLPTPPNATLAQSYTASVPAQGGCTYQWSVLAGSATLAAETTHVVTFTPTALGALNLQCSVTNTASQHSTSTYAITVSVSASAVLEAYPDTITQGQGTLLLATFGGTTGSINPGALAVTSTAGVAVTPSVTTTYTLTVDGAAVATAVVTVQQFVPKFVYVANTEESISAFTLNTSTGGLTAVGGSPYLGDVGQLVADPQGQFLFAAGLEQGVYAYTIASATGALTAVTGSPFSTDAEGLTDSVAVDPLARFVYASVASGDIYAFSLAPTGVLTPIAGSPFPTGDNGRGELLVHPSGRYLYAAVANADRVDAFSIDQDTGALVRVVGAPYGTGVNEPVGMAVDPTGAHLFIKGESLPSQLAAFSVDIATGGLSAVPGSPLGPLEGSDASHGLCCHPTKTLLYTAFYGSEAADVAAYTPNLGTGVLAPMAGSPYDLFSTHGSDTITVDRSGQFSFVVNYFDNKVKAMRVNVDGLLTKLNGAALDGTEDQDVTPVGSDPTSVVVVGALQ